MNTKKRNRFRWKKAGWMLAVLLLVSACGKKETPAPDDTKTGTFSIEFDNVVGEETFGLEPREYKNAKNEKFRIKLLQYFISSIKLYKADGSEYKVPQKDSYFLVQGQDRSTRFTKVQAPEGDYTKVKFTLGVDREGNMLPVDERTGVLSFDPTEGHEGTGMYWEWNSGYIFLKFEGYCDLISDDQNGDPTGNKQFKYHIGFFGGYSAPTLNNLREIEVDLQQAGIAEVREGLRSNVHLFVDLMKVFDGPNSFRIAERPNVMFDDFSSKIADNFPTMFTHDHTENFVKSEDEL